MQPAWQQPQRRGGQIQEVRRVQCRPVEVAAQLGGRGEEAAVGGHRGRPADAADPAGRHQGKQGC